MRLHFSPIVPKSLQDDAIYGIVSRNTLLGFHRTQPQSHSPSRSNPRSNPRSTPRITSRSAGNIGQFGEMTPLSKTMLLFATNHNITDAIINHLETHQQQGVGFNRVISPDNEIFVDTVPAASIMPYNIEVFQYSDLERLCHIHNFDMYIAYHLESTQKGMQEPTFDIYGYEIKMNDISDRKITERYLRDMLR